MKSSLEEANLIEKNELDKALFGHDGRITNKMIKITYKKSLKDHSDGNSDSENLDNSELSLCSKSSKVQLDNNGIMLHSTPKSVDADKKTFFNGALSLTVINESGVKKFKPDGESSSVKAIQNKTNDRNLKNSDDDDDDDDDDEEDEDDEDENVDRKISNVKKKKQDNGITQKKGLKRKLSGGDVELVNKKAKMEGEKVSKRIRRIKKQILLVDPDLPKGWSRYIRTKNSGTAHEQYVVYVVNPQGKKFRFKWKLRRYLEKTNSSLNPDQFFFGLYERKASTSRDSGSFIERQDSSSPEPDKSNQGDSIGNSEERELLLYDPDLPFGWKRTIHSDAETGKKQVHIISPDGKIFRRRYRLHEYLTKHQFPHDLSRFYFGLYPKNDGDELEEFQREDDEEESDSNSEDCNNESKDAEKESVTFTSGAVPTSPMYVDPNLPEGWKRFIKIRSLGESAGRMEVVIVSPDGRRHRNRKHLEHYLEKKRLNLKAKDFDFTVFGKSSNYRKRARTRKERKEPETETSVAGKKKAKETETETSESSAAGKTRQTDKPVPELDINSIKQPVISPEGRLINKVTGLMLASGLSSARSERRQRLPRKEHEKQLRKYFESEEEAATSVTAAQNSSDGPEIPSLWINRLLKCRADFKVLEPEAVAGLAESVKYFLRKLASASAASVASTGESELNYEDLAEVVERTECLSFLRAVVPKKITFREFIRINRPKQFLSFT